MIRKLNLGLLTSLPLLALLFGVLCIRTASATNYEGACPRVIGTVENCPEGTHFKYIGNPPDYNSSFPTCHTVAYRGWDGEIMGTGCCQYESWWVKCVPHINPDPNVHQISGMAEYFRSHRYSVTCYGNGTCGSSADA